MLAIFLTRMVASFFHSFIYLFIYFIIARRYASAVSAVIVRPSVCLSVCLSVRLSVHLLVGVLLRWLNLGSRKQRHTIAQGLLFTNVKDLGEKPTVSPPTGAPNRGGVRSDRRSLTNMSLYPRNGAR